MNDLRTEHDLRAALDELSRDAPEIADVLPGIAVATAPRRQRLRRWAPVAAVLAVVAVAVGVAVALARNDHSAPPTSGGPSNLVGIDWRVHSVGGTPAASRIRLKIEPNGRFGQNLGSCMYLQGHLSIAGTLLKIEHVRQSSGLCPYIPTPSSEQQQQAKALKDMLIGTVSWSIHDGQLTLSKAGVATIVYVRSPHSPAQTRQWTFHGVGVSLPASWQENAVRCSTPIANTVIFPGAVTSCTYPRPPGVSSVQFNAYDASYDPFAAPPPYPPAGFSIDGVETTERITDPRESLQIIEVQIRSRGVTVTITSPSRTEALNLESELYMAGR
jgi:hypothetical protein